MVIDDFGVERQRESLAPNRWEALLGSILDTDNGNALLIFN